MSQSDQDLINDVIGIYGERVRRWEEVKRRVDVGIISGEVFAAFSSKLKEAAADWANGAKTQDVATNIVEISTFLTALLRGHESAMESRIITKL